jgi:hypothetical protein
MLLASAVSAESTRLASCRLGESIGFFRLRRKRLPSLAKLDKGLRPALTRKPAFERRDVAHGRLFPPIFVSFLLDGFADVSVGAELLQSRFDGGHVAKAGEVIDQRT